MTGLTEYELNLMRAEDVAYFTDTCAIYTRSASVDDPWGGTSGDTETLSATVPCMLESGAGQEQYRELIAQIEDMQVFIVTLPAGTVVHTGDHLHITSQGNLQLRVQAVLSPESYELEVKVVGNILGEQHE